MGIKGGKGITVRVDVFLEVGLKPAVPKPPFRRGAMELHLAK
jgi:hypothetical protein